jgi:hypothetical protein
VFTFFPDYCLLYRCELATMTITLRSDTQLRECYRRPASSHDVHEVAVAEEVGGAQRDWTPKSFYFSNRSAL